MYLNFISDPDFITKFLQKRGKQGFLVFKITSTDERIVISDELKQRIEGKNIDDSSIIIDLSDDPSTSNNRDHTTKKVINKKVTPRNAKKLKSNL